MVYNFFDKKSASPEGTGNKSEIRQNQQLAEELHKLVIRKFKNRQSFKDNIWGADLAYTQLIRKLNKRN